MVLLTPGDRLRASDLATRGIHALELTLASTVRIVVSTIAPPWFASVTIRSAPYLRYSATARRAHSIGASFFRWRPQGDSRARQRPVQRQTPLFGPSVEALIDDLPVAKALGQIAPRDADAKSEQNGFDEQAINMALAARQNVLDPIPLIVAQPISSH